MRILVVDDELPMRTALTELLQSEGYRVTSAQDGEQALEMACGTDYDLILLDIMMPKIDGLTVCRELRKRGRTMPILMLTARARVDDCVAGLDSGADDYLVKPFSLTELLARVRAQLRKATRHHTPDVLQIGRATVHLKQQTCQIGNQTTDLNTKECGILTLLAQHAGEVVTREQFLDSVWGYHAAPTARTVDNFITELRRKLGEDAKSPQHLITVRGSGYRLILPR